jgi:Ribosomal RNA large subunit methyltransferase D, RlmJ
MANLHFAEIGDVWKHLPLAQVLAIERPDRYWETHAGSALYPLTPSPRRDYGAYRVLAHAGRAPAIDRSVYLRLLRQLHVGRPGGRYPGSTYIAMAVLGATADEYCVADTDPASFADLRGTAARLVGFDRVRVVEGDGVAAILEALSRLEAAAASTAFALIDPYRPLEPTAAGLSPAELWARLASRGVKTVLWYGFETVADHAETIDGIRAALDRYGVEGRGSSIWAGEITVAGFGSDLPAWNPGVPGCGILCANLTQQATVACQELGSALESLFIDAVLPNDDDGSLDFRTLTRW